MPSYSVYYPPADPGPSTSGFGSIIAPEAPAYLPVSADSRTSQSSSSHDRISQFTFPNWIQSSVLEQHFPAPVPHAGNIQDPTVCRGQPPIPLDPRVSLTVIPLLSVPSAPVSGTVILNVFLPDGVQFLDHTAPLDPRRVLDSSDPVYPNLVEYLPLGLSGVHQYSQYPINPVPARPQDSAILPVPNIETDLQNRSFESDVNPPLSPSCSSDYRRILNFIIAMFPEAQGEEIPARLSRSVFESIFPNNSDPVPPLPKLRLFKRVGTELSDADERLAKFVSTKKPDRMLLPRCKPLYGVTGLPSEGKAVPLNNSIDSQLSKSVPSYRDISLSLVECSTLESTFWSQVEALSHSMWVLMGLLGLLDMRVMCPRIRHYLINSSNISLSVWLTRRISLRWALHLSV